jgi:MFS superfamily sulfate permease-like transporter
MWDKTKEFFTWIYKSSEVFWVATGIILGFQLATLLLWKLGVWLLTLPGFIVMTILFYVATWAFATHKERGLFMWWDERPWRDDSDV